MLLLQQHVGFLVILFLFVFSLELGVTRAWGGVWPWAIIYLILAFLFLIAAFIALGFHA